MLRDENGKFIKGNEGFWKGKKREGLVLEHAFKKGQKPWNIGTKGLMPVPWNKGRSWNESERKKISIARKGIRSSQATEFQKGQVPWSLLNPDKIKRGENSHRWKGDDVGYGGVHQWVYKALGKPAVCTNCTKTDGSKRSYHWHNISGEYKRDLDDWIRLCSSCHRKEHGYTKQRSKTQDNRD